MDFLTPPTHSLFVPSMTPPPSPTTHTHYPVHSHAPALRRQLENVLLSTEGHAVLTDFGMAKERNSDLGSSKMESVVGTPAYMAPEIILEEPYGQEVDYWALGVLGYELVVGRSPFEGADLMQTCLGILQKDLMFPSHVKSETVSLLSGLLQVRWRREAAVHGVGGREAWVDMCESVGCEAKHCISCGESVVSTRGACAHTRARTRTHKPRHN